MTMLGDSTGHMASRTAWWRQDGALGRVLADLIAAEARILRPGWEVPWQGVPAPETWLDMRGIGFDSLELLGLATAFSETLCLHRSGLEDYLLARRRFGDWCAVAAQSLAVFSAELVVRTSGSMGEPRRCPHRLAALEEEAAALARIVPAGRRRVLSAVPGHHIYGFLFTVLLPSLLATPHGPVPVLDVRSKLPGGVAAMARPGDLIVGHPAFWASVADGLPPGGRWPLDVVGVTSTAPCPDTLADRLAACGLGTLIQVYGSSETAGLGWRTDPRTPYTLQPHWQRQGTDTLSRRLAGPPAEAGWHTVSLPDRLNWVGARQFHVAGRHDGAVQVGGVNVFPGRIAAILAESPLVAAASVRLMRPEEGQRLKAFVVPCDRGGDPAVLRRALDGFARTRLAPVEQPRAYEFGPALPIGAMGKPADWPVREPAMELHA